jgi:hypothetical protein
MMSWKGFVRKRSWPNFKVLSRNFPGGPDENHEKLKRVSRHPGRDLNPVHPECEAGVLTIP